MQVPTLITNDLILRALHLRDAPAVFVYASDPCVTAYVPWQPHTTIQHTQQYLRTLNNQTDTLTWAIVLQKEKKVIGECSLMRTEHAQAELHYVLAKNYWGHGFATQAAHAITLYAFTQLDISVVQAWIMCRNHKSINVARRLGMECELVIEQQWYNGTTYEDLHLYSIRR